MSYKLDIQDDLMSIQDYTERMKHQIMKRRFYDICRVRVIRV